MFGLFGVLEVVFGLFFIAFVLLGSVFWVWMLVECAIKERNDSNDKIIWILIILFTHLIGALIYFFVRRPRRLAEIGL